MEEEKPDEAAAIREKIAEINNVWVNLKDMVSRGKSGIQGIGEGAWESVNERKLKI